MLIPVIGFKSGKQAQIHHPSIRMNLVIINLGEGGVAPVFWYHRSRYQAGTGAPESPTGVIKISF